MRHWDLFCRVVDNYGDIGTCWRLAKELALLDGVQVRLWVDELESLACLCPSVVADADQQQFDSIEIRRWAADFPEADVADVVVEAFACELPATYVAAMTRRPVAPVWINLEYLSAEAWVEDCHLLTSPRSHSSLTKHFFFPGFTSRTGGLLHEAGLPTARAAFAQRDPVEIWGSLNLPPPANGELRVSLFCYTNPALPELLDGWVASPEAVCVLATPGHAAEQVSRWCGQRLVPGVTLRRGSLTVHALPFLPQPCYDQLLWACDVNFVRGEDSFVRAQWAERPFIWQIYPQTEETHLVKLEAFLERYTAGFPAADVVRRCWRAWNGSGVPSGDMAAAWRDYVAQRPLIEQHGRAWAVQLDRAGNLVHNLSRFVSGISVANL